MTRVVFVAPLFSPAATGMIEAAVAFPGARVSVVSQEPLERLAPALARALVGHWRVDDVTDADALERAVRALAAVHGQPHRVYGAYEQLQLPLAIVRERLGIVGLPSEAARNFRDKARMKDVLRASGVPVARHRLVRTAGDLHAFAADVGFPVVIKPPAGAGARATHRLENAAALESALRSYPPSPADPMLAEEFLQGTEHSLETVSIGGDAVWHSLTEYTPTPLTVIEHPWMQWTVLLPREVDAPRYDDIRDVAAQALRALGMTDGVSHTEWFRRGDGSLAISEIAARPPGAQITTMVSRANDFDFVAAWTRVMIAGEFTAPDRKYAVGTAYLRGQGRGVVRTIDGIDVVQREFGALVCDWRLPTVGQAPTGSYEGEGFVIVRHPDTEVVRQALARIVSVVRIGLG